MKLLTHNMLACHIQSHKHTDPQPFLIEAKEVSQLDADYDPDFLRRMYKRIIWSTLHDGAAALGKIVCVPPA
jgi:multifunctional methyltransferase subunit TRM112